MWFDASSWRGAHAGGADARGVAPGAEGHATGGGGGARSFGTAAAVEGVAFLGGFSSISNRKRPRTSKRCGEFSNLKGLLEARAETLWHEKLEAESQLKVLRWLLFKRLAGGAAEEEMFTGVVGDGGHQALEKI